MITSSLPPELKVMIASGFLLGGGLLAQRYPADRTEDAVVARTAVTQRSETSASPSTPQEPSSVASGIDDDSRFVPIHDYFNSTEDRRELTHHMSMSEPIQAMDTGTGGVNVAPGVAETSELDREYYAGMVVDSTNLESPAVELETVQRPAYVPFQTTTHIAMPDPNPAFFAAKPSPPNLTGFPPLSGESETENVVSRAIVSPSAIMQSGGIVSNPAPLASAPPVKTTVARPVIPERKVASETPRVTISHNPPAIAPAREPRSTVFLAPARTTILPNP